VARVLSVPELQNSARPHINLRAERVPLTRWEPIERLVTFNIGRDCGGWAAARQDEMLLSPSYRVALSERTTHAQWPVAPRTCPLAR